MSWKLLRRAALSAAIGIAITVLAVPQPARADTVHSSSALQDIEGDVVVYGNTTAVRLTIVRKLDYFSCTYAKIIINRKNWFDPDKESGRVCRGGDRITWDAAWTYSGTRDARFFWCFEQSLFPDVCSDAQYIPKR